MIVDSYKFLPRSFVPMFEAVAPLPGEEDEVWAPFGKRLAEARIAMLTSAGLYLDGEQESFDLERERREPTWGDPSLRLLPGSLDGHKVGMAHLHVNSEDVLADPEIALPLNGLAQLADQGVIGAAAETHYSVMGYQEWGLTVWRNETAPAIVERLRAEEVDGLLLAPA